MKTAFEKFNQNRGKNKMKNAFIQFMSKPKEEKKITPFDRMVSREKHFGYLYKIDEPDFPPPDKYRPKKLKR